MNSLPVRRLISLLSASALVATLAVASLPAAASAATPTNFFNGFETSTAGWFGSITQQPSGYTNGGGYASGIASATGAYHARLGADASVYTQWGGYTDTFPVGGYTTKLDIYLDVTWAAAHPDVRFDWLSSISDTTGGFLRDFAFNAGTTPSTYTGTAGFVIGASPNSTRSGAFPSNPCPSPSISPNACRTPVYITTSSWYTFVHHFRDAGSDGLAVDMSILDSSGSSVANWTIFSGDAMSTVGGNRYGWFSNQEVPGLPIDNSRLARQSLGFYAPIDNSPVVNTVKGGSVVPVKFNFYDGSGVAITDPSLVTISVASSTLCSATAPTDAIEILSAGSTALRYDATAMQFIWNWKTPKTAGSCLALTATAPDGVSITALFLLK